MIQARHSRVAEHLFEMYLRYLFRRHFHSLVLLGKLPSVPPALPLLLLPNHSTWWDGFFAFALNKALFRRPFYLMMLEEQLQKYRFFARLGAYSVRPGSPRSVAETLSYTASLLSTTPPPLVCVFPQGALLPYSTRPLQFQRGIEHLTARATAPVTLLPLAMRCEFLGEQLPDVFFLFGSPIVCHNTIPSSEVLEAAHHVLIDDLNSRIVAGDRGRVLFAGGSSINSVVDSLRRP